MKKAYLVGHGNGSVEEFIELLKDKKIETLVDVRSVPYSKFASQFNRENLSKQLSEKGINYVYMGEILGGRHPEGFDKYMDSNQFNKGIAILEEGISSSTSAIMCSEIDHTKCHRRFIGSKLIDEGFIVEDISKKGVIEKIAQKTLGGF
jgi:uncharacterized protein (DUF488 family)